MCRREESAGSVYSATERVATFRGGGAARSVPMCCVRSSSWCACYCVNCKKRGEQVALPEDYSQPERGPLAHCVSSFAARSCSQTVGSGKWCFCAAPMLWCGVAVRARVSACWCCSSFTYMHTYYSLGGVPYRTLTITYIIALTQRPSARARPRAAVRRLRPPCPLLCFPIAAVQSHWPPHGTASRLV